MTTQKRFVNVYGVDYYFKEQVWKRICEIEKRNGEYGLSDDRVTEMNFLEEAHDLLPHRPYSGPTVQLTETGKSHYVNGYDELFCGRSWEGIARYRMTDAFATCGSCRRAAAAAQNDEWSVKTGSPSRR